MVGPTLYLMRADSATVASVWSRNTTTKISDERGGQRRQSAPSSPSTATPAPDDPGDGPRADQQRGQRDQALRRQRHAEHRDDDRDRGGPQPAGGDRRSRPAPRSASAPNAISGSGRRPLLNGSHAARNTAPAVHTATRLVARPPCPSRGSTQRLMISQVADRRPAVAGSRIHTPAVLTDRHVREHRLVPVERRLGGAEEAVVVGGVAGVAGHPRDGQVVAVVGRGGADDVPEQQGADDADVGEPRRQRRRARIVATRVEARRVA